MQIFIALISLQNTLARAAVPLAHLPNHVRDSGFSGFEILDRQLAAASEDDLDSMQRACRAASCAVVVDASCDLTHAESDDRAAELSRLKGVIDKAERLRCNVVRITLGGQALSIHKLFRRLQGRSPAPRRQGVLQSVLASARIRRGGFLVRARLANYAALAPDKLRRSIQQLEEVLPYAEARGIALAVENHWGISTRPEWILDVIDAVDSPHIGTCPDFGNFPANMDRYAGLALLAPRALHVQAKCWRFDEDGNETTIDYARCMAVLRDAGYTGAISVEYEGPGDEIAACKRARELITRYV